MLGFYITLNGYVSIVIILPFLKINGARYLEVHHLKRLADGGSDTIENAVAVCPNCHRELHFN